MKASEWRELNPGKKGNIRDYASILELSILSNLEFKNSMLIKEGKTQKERIVELNKEANEERKIFCTKYIEGKQNEQTKRKN